MYRAPLGHAIAGLMIGGVFAAMWVASFRMSVPPGSTTAMKMMLARAVGWIIPALLLGAYSYQAIGRPALVIMDGGGLRRRTLRGERLVCWEDVLGVTLHRYGKASKVDVVLRRGERTEAERARAEALAGPWTRLQERGTTMRIENRLVVLPLVEIAQEIGARARPAVEVMVVDYPSVKQFDRA